ncbi:MAG: ABC transporter ATP-binding protein [Candidatus Lambdaproteobacteria bacterium]|nr:ABC transporter ATP-binding protein [Candidatus Lambdaproteobacteria bacterium]
MGVVLQVENLVKVYPGVKAVDGISLSIDEGTCFGLLGPNGAGKTTTVEMMEGLTPATSGEVRYRGRRLDRAFKNEVGIQFQATALQDYLTTREVLELFGQFYPRRVAVDELIEMCSLGEFQHQDNRKLSGGQRQRLFLALALVNDPYVLFLDEPTTGLDPQARRNFWALIERIKSQHKTIVLTTHYMDEAYRLCDEIAIMDHGRIIAQGQPQRLLHQYFDNVWLELPKNGFAPAESFPWKFLESREAFEIQTTDVTGTIRYLIDHGVSLAGLRVRTPTLEDLFLELTGRELRAGA